MLLLLQLPFVVVVVVLVVAVGDFQQKKTEITATTRTTTTWRPVAGLKEHILMRDTQKLLFSICWNNFCVYPACEKQPHFLLSSQLLLPLALALALPLANSHRRLSSRLLCPHPPHPTAWPLHHVLAASSLAYCHSHTLRIRNVLAINNYNYYYQARLAAFSFWYK